MQCADLRFLPGGLQKEWDKAKEELAMPWIGPPHDLRHAGASRDVEGSHRSLEEVRRRGRWRAAASVQRYTKTFWLVKQRARTPAWVLAKGQQLLQSRGDRVISN